MRRLAGVGAAVLLVAIAFSDHAQGRASGLSGGETLGPFFAKLETAGHHPGTRPVNILQIGDSQSANDNIAGAWREMLQERYGHGGRGVLPPGVPWGGYQRKGVTVGQSPGWLIESTMDRAYRDLAAHALFGISGFRLSTVSAGAYLTLTSDNADFNFDRLIVCAVSGPAAGAYDVTVGGQTTHVDLHADDQHVVCQTFQSDTMQGAAQVTVTAGPVTITSWGAFRDDGGVTVSNLGVVGAQITQFAETDDAADQAEITAYQPDLIVIAFGTNDGFVGHFEPQSFELNLRHEIRRVRRMAPGVPILLLGAPDAGAAPTRTDVIDNAVTSDPRPPPGAWFPPPGLAAVRQVQRHVAAELGLAYWDWGMRMGGPYTADTWANADPPLMRKDRVHYTAAGGDRIAGLLEADLDAARAAYILSDR